MKIPASLQTAFFTVLIIFILLYAFTKTLGPIPISVNSVTTTKTDLFSVTETGEAEKTAQKAQFTLGVTKIAPTADAARNEMNKVINQLVTDLQGLGIRKEDIQTANLNVNPNYDYMRGGEGTITGYTASQNLDVKTDTVDLANRAIDTATRDGVNVVNNVQFILDHNSQKDLEAQATKQAIEKAKAKAQQIAQLSGIKLGRIINVQVFEDGGEPPVMFKAERALDQAATNPTNLQPGENTIRVSVTLSYETL
jgi:uncharacterized protein